MNLLAYTYAEWVRDANDHPTQDIWRIHELFAREHYASDSEETRPRPYFPEDGK